MVDMPLSLGGLLRSPSDLAAAARSVLGWTDEAVQVVADLPGRVAALVDEAERLVTRVGAVLDRVDAAIERVEAVAAHADEVAAQAGRVATRADDVAAQAGRVATRADDVAGRAAEVAAGAGDVLTRADTAARSAETLLGDVSTTGRGAQELLDLYRPTAEKAAPLLRRFVDEFSDDELTALVKLVDQVPLFTQHMVTDVMPILTTLDRVGPDVHELLDVLKDVRLAIQGVPGFSLFRRRGAEKEDELADERPES
jgi:ABC-type transporter Mla subunit MlaD